MAMTPAAIRNLISENKTQWLRTHQQMEQYEAMVFEHPAMVYVPGTQTKMKDDVALLRSNLRKNNDKFRQMTKLLEEVLAEDEAMNGWKGEDRLVEL